jgi:hypothetical protein
MQTEEVDNFRVIDIAGLDKAAVLAALYNAARPQGMGFMQYDPAPMTVEAAQTIVGVGRLYFDYLVGRVMKVDIAKDQIDPWGYDRDNGDGAAKVVIDSLRSTGEVNNEAIQIIHAGGVRGGIETARSMIGKRTTMEEEGGATVMHLGISDEIEEKLTEAIEKHSS